MALLKKRHVISSYLWLVSLLTDSEEVSVPLKVHSQQNHLVAVCDASWETAIKDYVFQLFQLKSNWRLSLHLMYVFIDCAAFPPAQLLCIDHVKNYITS